jgi:para-nitrobenzyl esterase
MRQSQLAKWSACIVVVGSLGLGCSEEDGDAAGPAPIGLAPGPATEMGGDLDAATMGEGVKRDATVVRSASTPEAASPNAGDAGRPMVSIDDGQLVGSVNGKAQQFLGIPYAKPPVGALRWKRPQKNAPWQGTRDATKFEKRCAQLTSTQNTKSVDEDCLYLNVWTPDASPREKLPVMFWIHGGGNTNGSASDPLPRSTDGVFYSGHSLVEKDVVVVTINYRLGVFGFFSHPALGDEPDGVRGNQGLFDQALALAWVRDNIEAFGGDPEKVTIFGESAGSEDVCFHVASPVSRGLFRAALSQSGGCTTRNWTVEEGYAQTRLVAAALGCSTDAAGLGCLRERGVEQLLMPPPVAGAAVPSYDQVIDGEFLPEQPRALYDKGDIALVPYLLGSNTDEGTAYVVNTPAIPDEATLRERVIARFGSADYADAVLKIYPFSRFSAEPDPGRAAMARIIGDSQLVCSTYDAAIRAADAGLPTWLYNFDISNELPDVPATKGLGASHGSEIVYIFGTWPGLDAPKRAASDIMRDYWTTFAKLGDPNSLDQEPWPQFSAATDVRLNFALDGVTERADFRASECAFWRARYDLRFPAR